MGRPRGRGLAGAARVRPVRDAAADQKRRGAARAVDFRRTAGRVGRPRRSRRAPDAGRPPCAGGRRLSALLARAAGRLRGEGRSRRDRAARRAAGDDRRADDRRLRRRGRARLGTGRARGRRGRGRPRRPAPHRRPLARRFGADARRRRARRDGRRLGVDAAAMGGGIIDGRGGRVSRRPVARVEERRGVPVGLRRRPDARPASPAPGVGRRDDRRRGGLGVPGSVPRVGRRLVAGRPGGRDRRVGAWGRFGPRADAGRPRPCGRGAFGSRGPAGDRPARVLLDRRAARRRRRADPRALPDRRASRPDGQGGSRRAAIGRFRAVDGARGRREGRPARSSNGGVGVASRAGFRPGRGDGREPLRAVGRRGRAADVAGGDGRGERPVGDARRPRGRRAHPPRRAGRRLDGAWAGPSRAGRETHGRSSRGRARRRPFPDRGRASDGDGRGRAGVGPGRIARHRRGARPRRAHGRRLVGRTRRFASSGSPRTVGGEPGRERDARAGAGVDRLGDGRGGRPAARPLALSRGAWHVPGAVPVRGGHVRPVDRRARPHRRDLGGNARGPRAGRSIGAAPG